jgi:MFS family permease
MGATSAVLDAETVKARADGGVFAPRYRATTVGILLSLTAIAIEGMAVATIMPAVAAELGGFDGYGWAFSAFMLMSLLGAIGSGQAADRGQVWLPAAIGFASFSLGLVVASTAPSWTVLLVARCIQGLGAGCLGSIAWVTIARAYPEQLRPRLMALLSSAWIVPSLVGPAIAGQVAEHFSWRVVFVGILPAAALGAWMMLPALSRMRSASAVEAPPRAPLTLGPELAAAPAVHSAAPSASQPATNGPAPHDASLEAAAAAPRGAGNRLFAGVRLTVGVALVLLTGNLESLPLALGAGVVGLILAIPALSVLLPAGALRARRGGPAAVAMRGLMAFGFFGAEALIPLGLSTQRGLPVSLVGLALTAGALSWVAGSWIQDRTEALSHGSLKQRSLRATGGMLMILVGIVGVAATINGTTLPVWLAAIAWAVSGLGMGLGYPAGTLTALGSAAEGEEGSIASSLQVAETIGIAAGTGAVGVLLSMAERSASGMPTGLIWGFVLATSAIALAIVPSLRLAPPEPASPPPPRSGPPEPVVVSLTSSHH